MQKFSKRALALLASVMILVVAIAPNIGLVLGDSEENTLRSNLIEAWKNLEKTAYEPIAVPAENNDDGNGTRASVKSASFEGLTDSNVLGEYYLKGISASNADKKIAYSLCVDSLDKYNGAFVMSYCKDTQQRTGLRYNWQSQDLGTTLWSVAMLKGWNKFTVESDVFYAARSTITQQKYIWIWVQSEAADKVNVGSIMGTYLFKPALPEGAADMELSKLVAKAEALDMIGYPTEQAEAFNAALLAAKAALDPDTMLAQKLVNAWQGLEKTATEVVAVPNGGVNVPATVEGLADVSVLGSKWLSKAAFNTNGARPPVQFDVTDKWDISKYDSYTVWFSAFNGETASKSNLEWLTNWTSTQIAGSGSEKTGWASFTIAKAKLTAVTLNPSDKTWFRQNWGDSTVNTALSIGSIMGSYAFKPALPEGYGAMTLAELVREAGRLDLTGYGEEMTKAFTDAVAEAQAALDAKDPAKLAAAQLLAAWKDLSVTVTETVATPSGGVETPKTVEGLADASVLGSMYNPAVSVGTDINNFTFKLCVSSLDAYDTLFLKWYCEDSRARIAIRYDWDGKNLGGKDIWNIGMSQAGTWQEEVDGKTAIDAAKSAVLNQKTFWIKKQAEKETTMTVGSIMGTYVRTEPLPENAESLSPAELMKAAKKVNAGPYGDKGDAFKTALSNLIAALALAENEDTVRDDLIEAWKQLASEHKEVAEEVALVPESLTDPSGNAVVRKEAADKEKYGSYWYENVNVGTGEANKAPGWGWVINFSLLKSPVDLTKYKTLTFNLHATNNGTTVRVKVCSQVNHSNGTYSEYEGDVRNVAKIENAGGIKFLIETAEAGITHVSFGSVIGVYDYSPVLPENYNTLSLEKLVEAAKALDTAGFAAEENFREALAKAELYADMSGMLRNRLIDEWNNLKVSYTEVLAVPNESYPGFDGNTYTRQAITDDTTIQGVVDPKELGTYYVDKIALEKAGWNEYAQLMMSVIKEGPINFSRYSSIKVWAAGYDADGKPTKIKINAQVNASNSRWSEGTGWFGANVYNGDIIGNSIKVICEEGAAVKYLSLGCAMGTWEERPDRPEDFDALSFEELVAYAEKTDVSQYDATAFKDVLAQCRSMIDTRRQAVLDQWEALGLEKPDGIENSNITQMVDAALALDFTQTEEPLSSFGQAVWMLGKLTSRGVALDALCQAWKNVGTLPENYKLMTPAVWVEKAEAVDLSEVAESKAKAFNEALELVRDLLTQGKADVEQLKELVKNAKTMKSTDFANDGVEAFTKALAAADKLLTNYDKTTQKAVDAAKEELLTAWGGLRAYKRTLWLNFLDYYTGVDPQAGHGSEREVREYGALMKLTDIPNGATTGLSVKGQQCGWNPVNHSGIELENLKGYEYIELYLKADAKTFNGATLYMQWMLATGTGWYDVRYNLPANIATGEWERIEIPLSNIKTYYFGGKQEEIVLSENGTFRAGTIRLMIENGKTCDYEISSIAAVKTEKVTAGVVPKIEKMVVKERVEEPIVAPENPFKGVDRKDPWGDKEKAQNSNNNGKDDKKDDVKKPSSTKVQTLASGTCGANLKWELKDNGELIISGTGAMNDYDQQAPWNAYLNEIVTVTVKDGVTRIGNGALFGASKLQLVTLPDSVTEIGETAFYECPSLKFMVVPATVKTIGAYAIGLVYDASTNGATPVSGFGIYGTTGSAAEKYAEEYGLEFYAIALGEEEPAVEVESGTCGANVTWTFYSDGTLKISGTGDMDSYDDTTPWEAYLTRIKKVEIAEGVTGIGDSAFYGCQNLTAVSIPDGVTKIGNYAFYECPALQSAKVPASVTEVGGYAFGFVYDEAADDVALRPDFVLSVAENSAAHKYAETNQVKFELYQTGGEPGKNTDNPVPNEKSGLPVWAIVLIVVGGVLVLGGTCLILVLTKRNKKDTAKTEVSDQ